MVAVDKAILCKKQFYLSVHKKIMRILLFGSLSLIGNKTKKKLLFYDDWADLPFHRLVLALMYPRNISTSHAELFTKQKIQITV